MFEMIYKSVSLLTPNARNARTHSKKQISQIASSIQAFGFVNPILVDENNVLIAGHGRLEAALRLGLTEVPVIVVCDLTDAQKRALMLADNKIAAKGGWDRERLAVEIPDLNIALLAEGLDISLTGFDIPEIDQLLVDFDDQDHDKDDRFEESVDKQTSRFGDMWQLGPHRLLCGNARIKEDLDRLMGGTLASMAFLDPPYNVAVKSIGSRGKTKHREFAEASGEQSIAEFTEFLCETLSNTARVSADGALHYVCMDWRHIRELMIAAQDIYAAHVNTAIWVKSNAGQGSFYRSQHEEVLIYRVGDTQHLNNIELGKHGRSRSNVWNYPGVNTFRTGRMDELRVHPTVKPIALVSDAMRDCTKRNEVVLDVFCGSGTTILAAERVGRHAYAMEIDPIYVDTAIRRWQDLTGKDAVHSDTGLTFNETQSERLSKLEIVEPIMSRKDGDDSEKKDGKVGYGKPPKHSQFPVGKSGNPDGRPPGAKNKPKPDAISKLISNELSEPIEITQGGKKKTIPTGAAIIKRVKNDALNGDRHAQKQILALGIAAEETRRAEEMKMFDYAHDYVQKYRAEAASRRLRGLPEINAFPRPEDFVFDYDNQTVALLYMTPEQEAIFREQMNLKTRLQNEILAILNNGYDVEELLSAWSDLRDLFANFLKISRAVDVPWQCDIEGSFDRLAMKSLLARFAAKK